LSAASAGITRIRKRRTELATHESESVWTHLLVGEQQDANRGLP
jgi:hypothetical protein